MNIHVNLKRKRPFHSTEFCRRFLILSRKNNKSSYRNYRKRANANVNTQTVSHMHASGCDIFKYDLRCFLSYVHHYFLKIVNNRSNISKRLVSVFEKDLFTTCSFCLFVDTLFAHKWQIADA